MANALQCPYACGFTSSHAYELQLHFEEEHTEDSPFVVKEKPPPPVPEQRDQQHTKSSKTSSNDVSDGEENPWIKCMRPGCPAYMMYVDLDDHYTQHTEQDRMNVDEAKSPSRSKRSSTAAGGTSPSPRKLQRPVSSSSKSASSLSQSLLQWVTGSTAPAIDPQRPRHRRIREPLEPGRLGRRELGPHAFEKRMPDAVRDRLIRDSQPTTVQEIGYNAQLYRRTFNHNETSHLIPVIADLCARDEFTVSTYLCSPAVRHVAAIRCDGNFCGYWSIQVIRTYLDSIHPRPDNRPRRLPHVLKMQETIENAWDNGICAYSRIETGGIRNTRKWIGSHEALAYFTGLTVPVDALSFTHASSPNMHPVLALLDHIEAYFLSARDDPATRHRGTSHITPLAPIYFQRLGHSMTIVGVERGRDGSRNLLVFDSSYDTSAAMQRVLSRKATWASDDNLLSAYRRSDRGLARWDEFEIVVPNAQTQQPPASVSASAA